MPAQQVCYNCGILGGRAAEVRRFFSLMETAYAQVRGDWFCDMIVFNYVIAANYTSSKVFTGYPLHTVFKKWEVDRPSVFRHK